MKKYFTRREKINGELACKSMSAGAKEVYYKLFPIDVYEIEIDDETVEKDGLWYNKEYSVRGCFEADGLTFEQLEELFEYNIEDCIDEEYEEYDED